MLSQQKEEEEELTAHSKTCRLCHRQRELTAGSLVPDQEVPLPLRAGGLPQVAPGEVGDPVRPAHLLLAHLPAEAPRAGAPGLPRGRVLLAVLVGRAHLLQAGF